MPDQRTRTSWPFRVVALWMGALGLAAAAIAGVGYLVFLHYERVAALHLPEDTVVAARVDVGQAALYEPVREHLLPLVAVALGQSADSPELWQSLEEEAGLRRRDLREIVVGWGANPSEWVLIVHGLFPKDVVGGLGRALGPEWSPSGPMLAHRSTTTRIGQAEDGAIVIAPDRGRLEAALKGSERHRALGLDTDAALAGAARAAALERLVRTDSPEAAGELGRFERVTLTIHPTEPMRVAIRLYPATAATPPAIRSRVEHLLSIARKAAEGSPGRDWGGERAVIGRSRVAQDKDSVVISTAWTRAEAGRAAAELAAWLSDRLNGASSRGVEAPAVGAAAER